MKPTPQPTHTDYRLLPISLLIVCMILPCLSSCASLRSGTGSSAAAAPQAPLVAVIQGDRLGENGEAMRPLMLSYTRAMCTALDAARIPYTTTSDSVVEKKGLPAVRLAVLPYNRAMSQAEVAALVRFVEQGGKIIVCFLAPPDLLTAIGARGNQIIDGKADNGFAAMSFAGASLPGLPSVMKQRSERIRACAPLDGAIALGRWQLLDGALASCPAAILSDRGAFLSYVLLENGDRQAQAELMRALCGQLVPDIWQRCIPASVEDIRPLGNYQSLGHMERSLLDRQRAGESVASALTAVAQVRQMIAQAHSAVSAGNVNAAAQICARAEAAARHSYWMSYPSRQGELRGVWACNSAPGGWDKAMKTLRESNLNSVFPYVASAGVAWYKSAYLPMFSDTDYLAEAVAAGKKYGVPVHARTLGLYTMCAPASFKAKLKQEGRLVVDPSGKTSSWLCAVNPANRRLMKQLAVEIVSKYAVTGLQFDYLRYPGDKYCFCPVCRESFNKYVGKKVSNMPEAVTKPPLRNKFLDWRRKQITELVREIGSEVMAVRPDIVLSAAVFLNWEDHRDAFAQDWKKWVDWGLVDLVCPMSYTPINDRFAMYVGRQVKWVDGQVPLAPGIGVNADNMTFGGPQALLDQITIARNMETDGWVIFNLYDELLSDYLPYLRLGATSTPSSFNPFRHVVMPPRG